MPVRHLIQGAAFEPEVVALMCEAYDCASRRLGGDQPAGVLETVAKRIIECARRGERDGGRLTAFALRGLDAIGKTG
jgi:hypothetical protein